MERTKVTKKDILNAIISFMAANDIEIDTVSASDIVEFCEKEIAAIDKKNAKARERAAEKRAAGDELLKAVEEVLTTEYQATADVAAAIAEKDFGEEATFHKIGYRLRQLVSMGVAESTDIKIPGGEGTRARTVKGYRLANVD
jgi:hypothetical protein